MKKKKIYIFIIICVCVFGIYYYFAFIKDYTSKNESFGNLLLNNDMANGGENSNSNGSNLNDSNSQTAKNEQNSQADQNIVDSNNQNLIKIYITGEVKKTGVYELSENSRISDAIDIAGGITENANVKYINLAFKLEDGMQIYIPNKNENLNNLLVDKTYIYITSDSQVNLNGNSSIISGTTRNSGNLKSSNSISTSVYGVNSSKSTNTIIDCNKKININLATKEELEQLPGIGESIALKICDYRKKHGNFKSKDEIKNVSRNWKCKI